MSEPEFDDYDEEMAEDAYYDPVDDPETDPDDDPDPDVFLNMEGRGSNNAEKGELSKHTNRLE